MCFTDLQYGTDRRNSDPLSDLLGIPDAVIGGNSDPFASLLPPDFSLDNSLDLLKTAAKPKTKSEFLSAIFTILFGTPTGRTAVWRFNEMGIKYEINTSVLSEYYHGDKPEERELRLNANEPIEEMALTFVHEVNHAWYHHTGKTADISSLGRQEYIDANIHEEAEGAWLAIEAKMELEGSVHDNKHLTHPQDKKYIAAYNKHYAELKAKGETDQNAQKGAKEYARKKIKEGFYDGTVGVGDGKGGWQTYVSYYGKEWDDHHKP